jgi:hypothetical protein
MDYTHLEFRADYPRVPGEAGREVMERLMAAMAAAGFNGAPPVAEDWGWACALSGEGFSLLLGCSPYAEYGDGWLCFVEGPRAGMRRLLQPQAARTLRRKAVAAMHGAIAADPRCRDLKWWTDDTGVGPLVAAA